MECYIQGDLCPLCFSNLINIQYIVPTHFSLSVFQPFWAQNTARDTWTLWGNGIRASIVRIPTRVTTSSVAEQKYTSIAAPKKTKSFSQKYKSKYPTLNSGCCNSRSILKFVFLQFDGIHWDCSRCGGCPVNYHLGLVFLLFMLLSVQETSSIFQ